MGVSIWVTGCVCRCCGYLLGLDVGVGRGNGCVMNVHVYIMCHTSLMSTCTSCVVIRH
jgi:hypothetical protein